MNFGNAIITCFRKYASFAGRATRAEFWYWALFSWLLSVIAYQIDSSFFGVSDVFAAPMPVTNIVNLCLFLPSIAVSIRRLHDVNRSGWWFLLAFTIIGIPLLLYWYIKPSTNNSIYS